MKDYLGRVVVCPECGGTNVRVVPSDGGYECLDCQTPEHESWFWVEGPQCLHASAKDSDRSCPDCGQLLR